jgi:hypothetical protein
MRIASGRTDAKLSFVAVDATDLSTRETGLSSFTVYRSRNGGTATAYTTPTVTELSSANMPGVYVLTLDEGTTITDGVDEEEYVVHITATGMAPVTRAVELFRPKYAEGSTISETTIADAMLNRDMSVGTDSGSASVRTPRQALRMLRNKVSVATGTLTVTKEDDTTASWTAAVTTDAAADPITAIDPAS